MIAKGPEYEAGRKSAAEMQKGRLAAALGICCAETQRE
jgi:hypothetical protein